MIKKTKYEGDKKMKDNFDEHYEMIHEMNLEIENYIKEKNYNIGKYSYPDSGALIALYNGGFYYTVYGGYMSPDDVGGQACKVLEQVEYLEEFVDLTECIHRGFGLDKRNDIHYQPYGKNTYTLDLYSITKIVNSYWYPMHCGPWREQFLFIKHINNNKPLKVRYVDPDNEYYSPIDGHYYKMATTTIIEPGGVKMFEHEEIFIP